MSPSPPAPPEVAELPDALVLYDGVCGFCDSSVQRLLDLDKTGVFHFATLQGTTAAAVRARHPDLPYDIDTVIFVERCDSEERVSVRSAAVLRITARLGGAWRFLGVGWVLPAFLRDAAYRAFAAVRYRLFGTLESCRIPAPEERARFLA